MSLVQTKRRAEGVRYEDQEFTNLDLRSMKAFGSTWIGCTFQNCVMDLADMRNSKFEKCWFKASKMNLANFAVSFFEDTAFLSCDLEQASFSGCHLRQTLFQDCRMTYGETMFQDATVKGKLEFIQTNLHGSNLDFREVEPGSLKFFDSNFWGARVSLGCAFWNGIFDERAVKQFLALIARVSQDERLKELAGDQYPVVCRAMDGRKGAADVNE